MVHFAEISPSSLIDAAANWKSDSIKVCAKKLSQILASNIDNGEGGLLSEFM